MKLFKMNRGGMFVDNEFNLVWMYLAFFPVQGLDPGWTRHHFAVTWTTGKGGLMELAKNLEVPQSFESR